jgi:hypothetical protein
VDLEGFRQMCVHQRRPTFGNISLQHRPHLAIKENKGNNTILQAAHTKLQLRRFIASRSKIALTAEAVRFHIRNTILMLKSHTLLTCLLTDKCPRPVPCLPAPLSVSHAATLISLDTPSPHIPNFLFSRSFYPLYIVKYSRCLRRGLRGRWSSVGGSR